MKNITFRQFMLTYNFRYYNENGQNDKEKEDTTIIKINYPWSDESYYADSWFEFGIDDFSGNSSKLQRINKIFSDYILNLYVDSISYNNEFQNVVNVYLTKEEYIHEINEVE